MVNVFDLKFAVESRCDHSISDYSTYLMSTLLKEEEESSALDSTILAIMKTGEVGTVFDWNYKSAHIAIGDTIHSLAKKDVQSFCVTVSPELLVERGLWRKTFDGGYAPTILMCGYSADKILDAIFESLKT